MTQKFEIHRKSASKKGRIKDIDIVATDCTINEPACSPIGSAGKSINDRSIPPFHILNKNDLEKELSKIEMKFGMTPEEFYKAWREGKVHGHEAMKLGCYYEFYKGEYE